MNVGYSQFNAPPNGIGNFKALFNKGVNLIYEDSLKKVDAVLLWGGADISPMLYAEAPLLGSGPLDPTPRDLFELELCKQAHKEGKPIIGICRGAQFICAFAGGKLVQNVNGHGRDHNITTMHGQQFHVTSSHHQMLYPFDVNHQLLAWSTTRQSNVYEGCAEAVSILEGTNKEPEVVYFPDVNGFAIQCHPEWHPEYHPFNTWVHDEIEQICFGVNLED